MSLNQLQEKWAPVLNHESLPEIDDAHKRGVVAQLLENQEKALVEEGQILTETLQTAGCYRNRSCCRFRSSIDQSNQTFNATTNCI